MSAHFPADWLSLREPVDARSRSAELADILVRRWSSAQTLRVIDLGSGHGSNQRWLAPRLTQSQHWTLVDHDAQLLERALASELPRHIASKAEQIDLADWHLPTTTAPDLVTASALFDLASQETIEGLAAELAAAGAAGLFALTVDGHWGLLDASGQPLSDGDTEQVRALFNRHQQGDKGLGQALGPAAAIALPQALAQAGMTVTTRPSPWLLAAGEQAGSDLARALVGGWAEAAIEQAQAEDRERHWIPAWRDSLKQALDQAQVGLEVGHIDVLALPES
ncbi:MAG: class I SAM-dependent methyltransferase [Wenzhouxiangella sp.]|nr:MAG: class I SAM-dependent methyltransferase [Wenzhouxiangella sp.]